MSGVENLGTIYVTADELPVIESPSLYFGDGGYGEYDSITDRFRTDDLSGWYHVINDIMDDISACEDASTPIDIEDLLDNICSLSEADFNSRTERIQRHVDNLNQKLSEIEATDEWKFLLDPENDPFKKECIISDRLITKVYRTAEERDNLLAGYSENMFNEGWNDDYIFPDGDEGFLDSSARRSLIYIKYVHNRLANGIKANQRNLIKLGIAKSSFFAIPARSLPPSVGLNREISDSHIARGVENRLSSICDGLAETFDCTFGMSCSNDIDNAAKNPNLGKELSNSDKVELGGTGSGTPPEWDPDGANISGKKLSISDNRSIHSLREQVRLHEEKLAAYRRNPDAFDNLGYLKNAPNIIARQKIINGRIRHLEHEIKIFKENINKIKKG
ncbi:hypothetical protein GKR48_05710 [Providencia sp. wls1943]|uniref:hypothetical protein n=1 Tax=Providencia sp. wls1943 TaxID=2675150 RepID=UPI0012B562DE|nr:hypothetical protein [Providencia sp. wls1943]MTB66316.1 hypothetical protein [Providencia sp. wls1943]